MSTSEKLSALIQASKGTVPIPIGNSKFRVEGNTVHVRFCSKDKGRSKNFKYNINPNTLTADFELWVCGEAATYYLMPVTIMESIYNDPNAYVDRAHPERRVVSVDTASNKFVYASGGKFRSGGPFLNAQLP